MTATQVSLAYKENVYQTSTLETMDNTATSGQAAPLTAHASIKNVFLPSVVTHQTVLAVTYVKMVNVTLQIDSPITCLNYLTFLCNVFNYLLYRVWINDIIFNMAYEILTDDGYSPFKVMILAMINIAATLYLVLYALSGVEMIVISVVVFLMFFMEVFTSFRLQKSLTNAIILVLLSGGILIGYQAYRQYEN